MRSQGITNQASFSAGVYLLRGTDVNGTKFNGGAAFSTFCDSNGWTMVLKVFFFAPKLKFCQFNTGATSSLGFSNTLWQNTALLNSNSLDTSYVDAKFNSWNTVPYTQLRITW